MAKNPTALRTAIANKARSIGKDLDSDYGVGMLTVLSDIQEEGRVSGNYNEFLIEDIKPNPFQPRKNFDEEKLKELSKSIKEHSLLSPIILTKAEGSTYYIIAGERRYRASKLAGLKKIKGIVIQASNKKMAELALIENIQRQNLNPIEEANSIKQFMDANKLTQIAIAETLGKSRSYIANSLQLLKLPQKIVDAVLNQTIEYSKVRPLITLTDEQALKVFERIIDQDLNVRQVENIVKGYKLSLSPRKVKIPVVDIFEKHAEDLFRDKIGSKVVIENNKIIIKFSGQKQLTKILDKLGIED